MGEHLAEDPRFAAFYGLLVTQSRISERLDAELQATAGVGLNRLELLLHLHFKDGRRRMSDLADALLLSRGGATRLVARAEDDGLVRREIPPDDRRATYAVLTDAGLQAAERGYPAYVEVVQRLFQDYRLRRGGRGAGARMGARARGQRDGLRAGERGGGLPRRGALSGARARRLHRRARAARRRPAQRHPRRPSS